MDDPCSNFASLYPSLDWKPLENLRDEEATLKSLVSSLIPCLILYSVLKRGILL